jgi:hypothetical protein
MYATAPSCHGQTGSLTVFCMDRETAFRLLAIRRPHKENLMSLVTILLIVLVLMLIGAVPSWPHSRNWGYGPSGGLGLVVLILIVLLLMGRI